MIRNYDYPWKCGMHTCPSLKLTEKISNTIKYNNSINEEIFIQLDKLDELNIDRSDRIWFMMKNWIVGKNVIFEILHHYFQAVHYTTTTPGPCPLHLPTWQQQQLSKY